ncbi:Ldh family oxidoreductase [Azorhizobium caulinodans]|uniref:Ldh family oxidoreductase n=1 Tax=Azorhizobium caulinodans TaxID=7 RepID=UPI002FBDCA56
MAEPRSPIPVYAARYREADLSAFCEAALRAAGADAPTVDAATRAMMHASRLGVDSHGVRLLNHYVSALEGGRVARAPQLTYARETGAVATLDAGAAHGALAAYTAMDRAMDLASGFGIGAVAIRNSSHFGPAGAFALAAAERGFVGLAFCNSDSFVRLHEGAERFHGTNPIAAAAPVRGARPWLFDMATSSVPFNRVLLYRSLDIPLPRDAASDAEGVDTQDANAVDMLAPLGGAFGFKGAGLAGLVEIFSALLSGALLSFDIAPMVGPDMATPRNIGAFVLAVRPSAFLEPEAYEEGMARYLRTLRRSRPTAGGEVLAPGDREWREADNRARMGIPVDPATAEAFAQLSLRYGLYLPETQPTAY